MRPHLDGHRFRRLPKAELHQHLDGSMRPATAVELARDMGQPLLIEDARARMQAPDRCGSQAALLAYFDLPISLLQTTDALRRVARELAEDLAGDGIRYAEVRWAPRLHLERGLSVREVIEAVAEGVEEAVGPRIGLIVTAMRSHPPGANVLLARTAASVGPPVVGFDLAGPEAEYPAPPHAAAFVAAAEEGLALTAHAGEVAGPERIREVLAFGVRRIAHGVTAAEDPELIARLRKDGVALDMCPTSNVQAGIVGSISEHPLGQLHAAGVTVTLSTDELTVSGTRLSDEYARVADTLGMSRTDLAQIALNGFRCAFSAPAIIGPLLAEAEQAWGAWAGEPIS